MVIGSMSYFILGKKINLRAFKKTDIPIWFKWFNDPEVTEHMNKGLFPNTEMLQEEFFQHISKSRNDIQLAIVLKESEKLVGTVGIHKIDWINRHGEVSILIGEKEEWGKNIATEAISLIVEHAFNKLNLHKLTAGVWSTNVASKRCFEKNGFVVEGVLKEQFFYKGRYVDEIRLGILRNVWKTKRNNKKE